MPSPLVTLHPLLRQLGRPPAPRVLQTGFLPLDAALQEGGWPLGALVELLPRVPGQAELWLLASALRAQLARPGWLVLVSPPGLPHAPAWAAAGLEVSRVLVVRPGNARDWLWSVDQAARAGQPAVLAWPGRVGLDGKSLRRLQLAAEEGGGLLVLSRRQSRAEEPSPAALRVALRAVRAELQLEILKQRGHWGGQALTLPLPFPEEGPPRVSAWMREARVGMHRMPTLRADGGRPVRVASAAAPHPGPAPHPSPSSHRDFLRSPVGEERSGGATPCLAYNSEGLRSTPPTPRGERGMGGGR